MNSLKVLSIYAIPKVLTIEETCLLIKKEYGSGVVAVNLHEDALTLHEDNVEGKDFAKCKVIIWGFESDGISSNLVPAMVVVLHRRWIE